MGLDTTHDCFHGAYSSFNRFRTELVKAAWNIDIGNLDGYGAKKGIPIETYKDDPLYFLIDHSDCDGTIPLEQQLPLADRLEELAPKLNEYIDRAKQFAHGLRDANALGEEVEFW